MGLPAGLADYIANFLPNRRLGDEVNVRDGIGLPTLALQDATGLAATGILAGARDGLGERNPFPVLAVFLERLMGEPLLVAQLDPRKVQHAVLHGGGHFLAAPGHGALIQRGYDSERQMKARAAVADLRSGN